MKKQNIWRNAGRPYPWAEFPLKKIQKNTNINIIDIPRVKTALANYEGKNTPVTKSHPSASRISKKKKQRSPQIACPVHDITFYSRPASDCHPFSSQTTIIMDVAICNQKLDPWLPLSSSHSMRFPAICKLLVMDILIAASDRYWEGWRRIRIAIWVRIRVSYGERGRQNTRISITFRWPTLCSCQFDLEELEFYGIEITYDLRHRLRIYDFFLLRDRFWGHAAHCCRRWYLVAELWGWAVWQWSKRSPSPPRR